MPSAVRIAFRTLAVLVTIPAFMAATSSAAYWGGLYRPKGVEIFPADGLELRVTFETDGKISNEAINEDFSVRVRCTWTNIARKDVTFLLKDHESKLGTMPYPWGMNIDVRAERDTPQADDVAKYEKLRPSNLYQSTVSQIDPGDMITLEPMQSVVRFIELDRLLLDTKWGHDGVIPLRPGTYRLRLSLGELQSEETLTLHVRPKADAGRPAAPPTATGKP